MKQKQLLILETDLDQKSYNPLDVILSKGEGLGMGCGRELKFEHGNNNERRRKWRL